MPIQHVAEFKGLGLDTVKAIDQEALEEPLGPVDLSGVRAIVMDEFAIQKGHRYATVIVDPTKRVLWVGRGPDERGVRPFFELLGPAGLPTTGGGDGHECSLRKEVRAQCPQAEIVYDLFHVVAKYGREVIDRVRVDEANRLRQDKRPASGQVLPLATAAQQREPAQAKRIRLRELLAANRPLLTVYVLKDDLKHLWDYRYPMAAPAVLEGLVQAGHAQSYRAASRRFAKNLSSYLDGILCPLPLAAAHQLLEGINNKIKVIKRMAYGFRDDAYFFLKIRAAFPGIPGRT